MTRDAYMQEVGEWIRARRTKLGLSQDALAQAIGVSYASISNWEAAKGMISSHSHMMLRAYFKQQRAAANAAKESAA